MTQQLTSKVKKTNKKKSTIDNNRDYCLFMDCTKYNRNIGCKAHDNAYGVNGGGSEKDRQLADRELLNHMRSNKDPLAWMAYAGVRFYGWFFFNYQSKWLWKGQLSKKLFPSFFG